MKQLKNLYLSIVSIVLFSAACISQKNTNISKLHIDQKNNFTFSAQSAQPLGDRMLNDVQAMLPPGSNVGNISLNGSYWVKISPDTLNCYLPYYGRAFSSDYGATKSVLNFTSNDFVIKEKFDKKGNQQIVYYFNHQNDVITMTLRNGGNGYATIQFQFKQRQPISFYGTIVKND